MFEGGSTGPIHVKEVPQVLHCCAKIHSVPLDFIILQLRRRELGYILF